MTQLNSKANEILLVTVERLAEEQFKLRHFHEAEENQIDTHLITF